MEKISILQKQFGDDMGDTPGLVILKLTKKAIEYDDRKSFQAMQS